MNKTIVDLLCAHLPLAAQQLLDAHEVEPDAETIFDVGTAMLVVGMSFMVRSGVSAERCLELVNRLRDSNFTPGEKPKDAKHVH